MLKDSFNRTLSVMAMLLSMVTYGQFNENFDSATEVQLENDCWDFIDVDISTSTSHLNSGSSGPHAHADVDEILVLFGNNPSITTPFLYFDGNTDISYKDKFTGSTFLASTAAAVYLVDINGNEIAMGWNAGPFNSRTVSFNRTEVGYYRIRWRWGAFGLYADMNAELDDFSTTASLIAPATEVDTVCENEMNVVYEFGFPTTSAIYYYDWTFVGTSGGSITPLTGNQRKAQVDWTAGPGDYQVVAKEYTDAALTNCTGRESYYDIYVHAIPDVEIVLDTACEGEDFKLDLEFEGIAPWTMKYKIDGGGNQTRTFNSINEVMVLPWGTSSFEITQLTDSGPCGKNNNLPIFNSLYYHPTPTTDPIYHY